MIFSKLYQLDTSGTEWQIAHLFEHLIICKFYSILAKNNIPYHLISRINGDSFEGTLFIDTLFYSKKLADTFDIFIQDLPSFTQADIAYSVATIEAEDKIIISINGIENLHEELNKLRKRQWNTSINSPENREVPKPKILAEKRAAKEFKDILIITKTEHLSPEEQRLYLRAHILLRDIITDALSPIAHLYESGDSDVTRQGQHMGFITKYTVAKHISIQEIRAKIATISLPNDDSLSEILRDHFEVFRSEPLWQNAPIHYFRLTGITTTNQEIASLATVDHIKSIMSKASFEVRRMTPVYEPYMNSAI